MMAEVECEIANMFIELNGNTTTISVPAYTRSFEEIIRIAKESINEYLSLTDMAGTAASLADLALYILSKAANEPRTQEDGKDG